MDLFYFSTVFFLLVVHFHLDLSLDLRTGIKRCNWLLTLAFVRLFSDMAVFSEPKFNVSFTWNCGIVMSLNNIQNNLMCYFIYFIKRKKGLQWVNLLFTLVSANAV